MFQSVFRLPSFEHRGENRGSGLLQKATPKSRATAARLDMRAPRLACAPLAYAGLLAALTSARRDEDRAETADLLRAALADDDDAGLKAALKDRLTDAMGL